MKWSKAEPCHLGSLESRARKTANVDRYPEEIGWIFSNNGVMSQFQRGYLIEVIYNNLLQQKVVSVEKTGRFQHPIWEKSLISRTNL